MVALLDSGSTRSFIHRSCLPKSATPSMSKKPLISNTAAGKLESRTEVRMTGIICPEFTRSKKMDVLTAYVIESPCRYDLILGRDFLEATGMVLDFSKKKVFWDELSVAMKPMTLLDTGKEASFDAMMTELLNEEVEHLFENDRCKQMMDTYYHHETCEKKEIQPSDYHKVDIDDVIANCTHLDDDKQGKLRQMMSKYGLLFNGELKKYTGKKIHLDVRPDAKPVHQRAFSLAKSQEELFKKELQHLVHSGVLERTGASEWASPTFIIPKKTGKARWVSDFRNLNKYLIRKQFPLPKIGDILAKRTGYKYFTKLDISMQYYTFELDDETSDLCTIATPFGLYRYKRLPMGVTPAPDIAQEIMDKLFHHLEECDVYIDDVGVFSNDYDEHIKSLDKILTILQDNGFTINPDKCEWAVQETDWLGYWLTPTGLKPWRKKIDAILRMQIPETPKQIRSFVGSVNFYRNMWPRRAHVLAPLTSLQGKKNIVWTDVHTKAFNEMKALMAQDCLLSYPDPNIPYDIETDASDYQMGAVIKQNGRPVAYFSRKLRDAQLNYTTIEKETLSIVECLREFHSMLYGARITIYTDHQNMSHQLGKFSTQRVLRWRLFLEQYGCIFKYIPGPDNVIADAFSRVPASEEESSTPKTTGVVDAFAMELDDIEMLDCFLAYPIFNEEDPQEYPLDYQTIQQYQQNDPRLQAAHERLPNKFPRIQVTNGIELIVYQREPNIPWRIAVPDAMLDRLITWYHQTLVHTGMNRTEDTINTHFYHPKIRERIIELCSTCDACQRYKINNRGYGHLPPRDADMAPWREVAVDLIGPWKVKLGNLPNEDGQESYVEFNALTCIDPVTNLVELIRINNKTAAHIGAKFEQGWLSRYPRPLRCIHDNGGEFTGEQFQLRLETNGIKDVPTTVKNPQANAICERMHQTVANSLRSLIYTNPPNNMEEANTMVDDCLALAMRAQRTAIHTALRLSPGAFVFQRDMLLDIPLIANMELIRERRQHLINEQLRRHNAKRISYDYLVNDLILIKVDDPTKMEERNIGPFPITQIHINGTVTIRRRPHVLQRINVRRIKPYRT
jgi:transposase InsO family protein